MDVLNINCPLFDRAFPALHRNQAVIQNPFSNGGSPGGDSVGGETRFAYFPTATVSDGTAVSVQATADPTITQAGGEKTLLNQHGSDDVGKLPLRLQDQLLTGV